MAVSSGVDVFKDLRAARRPLDLGGDTEREILESKLLPEL